MKIVEYKLIEEFGTPALEDMVNEHIKDGWQPYGVLVCRHNSLCQPMVKYERKTGVQIDLG